MNLRAADGPMDEGGQGTRTQAERRRDSRARLVDATLDLVAAGYPFEGLSLRQIAAKAGLAPSAFYRYFDDMDALGVALVDESFAELRAVLLSADIGAADRRQATVAGIIEGGIALLQNSIRQKHRYLVFIARQRVAGSPMVRRVVRSEIRVLTTQMAVFVARFEPISSWPTRDAELFAALIILALTSCVDQSLEVLSSPAGRDDDRALDDIAADTRRHLLYISLASAQWDPAPRAGA